MSALVKTGPRRASSRRAFGAVLFALLALAGCGGGDDGDGDSAAETTAGAPTTAAEDRVEASTVVLKNVKFAPAAITIKKGDTVTWNWDDGTIPHDVAFDDFKSEVQESGTFEHTFEEAGVFDYKCTVHPTMKGSVEVTE